MAYIKVNHRKLIASAEIVDKYVKKLDKNMQAIDTTMESLKSDWRGEDYSQLEHEWNEINSTRSTTGLMRANLRNYAGVLREASRMYKEQQLKSIERAKEYCS